MIILSAKDLTKVYGTDVILENVSFHINKGERVGIVGLNGAGKTTLLRMLTGELVSDGGECYISGDTRIGYLKQDGEFNSENTLIEEIENIFTDFPRMEKEMADILKEVEALGDSNADKSTRLLERYDHIHEDYRNRGGYSYKSEMTGVLSSMAFGEDTYNKKISTLSGGEKTRLALACLLLKKPDLLFLDEPTNHLDIGTLKWLEQYLKNYSGTIVLVSHDRYFLDQTVNRIFEIENHRLNIYEGNYSFYASERRARREAELRRYEKQQTEVKRQEEMIRRFKERGTEKLAKRAASREKRLSAMELMDRPDSVKSRLKLNFKENFQSGKDVIYAENLSKTFGYGSRSRQLFEGVNLDIKRGERICIVGANGIGKTTLLKMLLGQLEPTSGRLKIGRNVQMGYYDQGQQLLNNESTVIDEIHDEYRLYSEPELRSILGRFMFRGESVFLKVGSLSGGEKARLSLLKLMMSGANLLILDEPTNHLDIESKEVFEESLLDFPGTGIIVSHDRYFLNRVPTRILELTSDGIVNYLGRYDYYVEKKQEQVRSGREYIKSLARETASSPASDDGGDTPDNSQKAAVSSAEERRLKKEREAEERRAARAKAKLEEEIGELEEKIADLENQLSLPENMTDHVKLSRLSSQLSESKNALDEKYEKWMEME